MPKKSATQPKPTEKPNTRRYFLPEFDRVIVAGSVEEAIKIAKEEQSNG